MGRKFASFILYKVLGWHVTPGESIAPEDKCIYLFAPHTSIWDFAIGYLYYKSFGGKLKVMIKKEAFFWPVGPLLRALGGFPIDRKNSEGLIRDLIAEMNREGVFHLAMCPEGTRKAIRKWKMGYHLIASATGAPVYLSHMDYRTREVGCGKPFKLSGNARADTDAIQKIYASMHLTGLHPEGYVTE